MKRFEPDMRITYEKDRAGGINNTIKSELKKLDSKAKALREEGKDPRVELAGEVNELAGRISLGFHKTQQNIDKYLDEKRVEYEERRDRKPELELARMQRAKMKIDSMDEKELENMAISFAAGETELTHEEALAAMARIPEQRETFKEGIQDRMLDKPWIRGSEENIGLYLEAEKIKTIPPGNVLADNTAVHVEHLIDFDGELEKE